MRILGLHVTGMKLLALTITVLITQAAYAQDSTTIKVDAGHTIPEVVTPALRYHFPSFTQGRVLMKDKTAYDAKLNYNVLSGEIDFISPEGDTLAIADNLRVNIDRVIIDTNTYFYNNGYLKVVSEGKAGSLLKKQRFDIVATEKIGAYGMSSPTSAIDTYNSYMDGQGNWRTLSPRENVLLKLKTEYYLGNEYNLFLPATRKNLDKLFYKKRAEIETYLKEHATDFSKEDDLKKLLLFLSNSPQ
jgi:hypothetical protein